MTKEVAPSHVRSGFSDALRAAAGLSARVMIGAMLLATAGLVAIMTAFAGLMLGAAALVMRFAALRAPATLAVRVNDGTVTLNARRTPRGWTVE